MTGRHSAPPAALVGLSAAASSGADGPLQRFCDLLPAHGPLGLVGGPAVVPVAHRLARRPGLLIVTSSVDVVAAIPAVQGARVLLLPGRLSGRRTTYGPMAGDALALLNLDVVAIVADGVHPPHGVTLDEPDDVQVARALLARGRRAAVLALPHAIGVRAPGGTCTELDRVELLVTTPGLFSQPTHEMRREVS